MRKRNMVTELSIGEYILIKRRRLGLTQAELAERSGISRNTIACAEREDTDPYEYSVISALRALGVQEEP